MTSGLPVLLRCAGDRRLHDIQVADLLQPARADGVIASGNPDVTVAVTLLPDRGRSCTDSLGDMRIRHPFGGQQDDPRPLHQPGFDDCGTNPGLQNLLVVVAYNKCGCRVVGYSSLLPYHDLSRE